MQNNIWSGNGWVTKNKENGYVHTERESRAIDRRVIASVPPFERRATLIYTASFIYPNEKQ